MLGWKGQRAGLRAKKEVYTKQLVLQHAQLVPVKASANVGEELPTESRAQQAPRGFGGAGEELLILPGWEEGKMAQKQRLHIKLLNTPPHHPSPVGPTSTWGFVLSRLNQRTEAQAIES